MASGASIATIIIVVLILLITILIGISAWYKENYSPTLNPDNAPPPPKTFTWGPVKAGPDPTKNYCQLYQFPIENIVIDGIPTVVPPNPTFASSVLDSLEGATGIPGCLDVDQIVAQQVQHTCVAPQGVPTGTGTVITTCNLLNGGTTGIGGSEIYYSNALCPASKLCPGQLSVLSTSYTSNINNDICWEKNSNNQIIPAKCDPTNANQLFRITRMNIGDNPQAIPSNLGNSGLQTRIYDRTTGLCVVPSRNGSFTKLPGCGSLIKLGDLLTMGPCTSVYQGFDWLFFPSISYCPYPGGCGGCTGSTGCSAPVGSNVCVGGPGCTGVVGTITPPQFIYIGNLDLKTIPQTPDGVDGLSFLMSWLISQNARSVVCGGPGQGDIVLAPPVKTDMRACEAASYVSQYLNIPSYNRLVELEVCLANSTTACVGL